MMIKTLLSSAVFLIGSSGCAQPSSSLVSEANICSKLDFDNLVWPANLTAEEKTAFGLALNISGSFEGEDGWRNITNNFDGQGLSLGLLNQCLGEGSLQPLMIEMTHQHLELMKQYFGGGNFESLNAMLTEWKKHNLVENDDEDSIPEGFSRLDDEDVVKEFLDSVSFDKGKAKPKPKPKPKTPNEVSVDWAVKNLYFDGKGVIFTPFWMSGLTMMADSPEYRSIQLEKAASLHQGAMALFHHFKMTQVRSYLFFFDLMVQNGGINSDVVSTIDGVLKKKDYSEIEKMEQILKVRIKFVKPKYAADVKSRKDSLINGVGVVHGFSRNYDVEYCTKLSSQLYPDASDIENILNL